MKSVVLKILMIVTAVLCVLSLFAVGVMAATQGQLATGGSVSFTPVFPTDRGPYPLPVVSDRPVAEGQSYTTQIVDSDLNYLQDIDFTIATNAEGNPCVTVTAMRDNESDGIFTLRVPAHVMVNGIKMPVTAMGNNALSSRFNVDTLIIPKTITLIGENQFLANTRNLMRIVLLCENVPVLTHLVFPYSSENKYVFYVPAQMEEAYRSVMRFSPPYPVDYPHKEWLKYEHMLSEDAPFAADNGLTQKRLAVIEANLNTDLKFYADNDYLK